MHFEIKGWYFGKYAYWLSGGELNEKLDAPLISVL